MISRMIRGPLAVVALTVLLPLAVGAQTSPDDPAVQAAKEKTAAVFDLGRIFGYLRTLEATQPTLALSSSQLREVSAVMEEIKATKRFEVSHAEELLTRIEEEILTPEQLMAVDQIAIAKMDERASSGVSPGSGGGGQITSYLAGGPFNPMLDATKTIGKDFAAYDELVSKRLGR